MQAAGHIIGDPSHSTGQLACSDLLQPHWHHHPSPDPQEQAAALARATAQPDGDIPWNSTLSVLDGSSWALDAHRGMDGSVSPNLGSHVFAPMLHCMMQQPDSGFHGNQPGASLAAQDRRPLTSMSLSSHSYQEPYFAPQAASHSPYHSHKSRQQALGVSMVAMGNEASPKSLVAHQERQLIQLLHSLAKPVTDSCTSPFAHRLSTLRDINGLRGLTARTHKYKAMYCQNLRVLCPQWRWVELSPSLEPTALSGSMATVLAWRDGHMPQAAGLPFAAVGPLFKPAALSDLATVPISGWKNFGGHLLSQMVNAKAFSRSSGDEAARYSLQLMAWFTLTALSEEHSETIQAMDGHGFTADGYFMETSGSRCAYVPGLLDMLQLTKQQQKLAKSIWGELNADLAAAMEDRQRILCQLQASSAIASMQHGMQPDRVSETKAVLEQAVALAENSLIFHEITLHSQRRLLLQVLSPEGVAAIYTSTWPRWPDKGQLLRQIAESC
ncbi:hypothetical protein WJX74_010371 [Apatococcus lobatus]|uniref:Uncharacterized protein n=2 Tax=Apatococcus TaxID=904362 RepID=A0AAW1SB52_9CHLO